MKQIDEYYDGSDVLAADNGSSDYFRISPSGVSKFFSETTKWYRENLLGEAGFDGNTSTVLGTIVHHFAECAATGKTPRNPEAVVKQYLDTREIEIDREEVETHWKDMSDVLISEFVSTITRRVHSVEQFIFHKMSNGVYVAGSYDLLVKTNDEPEYIMRKGKKVLNPRATYKIVDYKTAAKKPSSFSYAYRMQSLVYAWVMIQKGYNVTHIELQYVVKPTKTLPVRHVEFTHEITEIDLAVIKNVLEIVAESVKVWREQPEMRHLLAQDIRLKRAAKRPKIF